MKIFSMEDVKKTVGDKTLFAGLSFSIREGDKIGIIGVNGTGKSTLLKIIFGQEEADQGIKDHPRDYTISYLPQEPEFDENESIIDHLFKSDTPLFKLIREYESVLLELQVQPENEAIQQKLFKLQHQMDEMNGWERNAEAKSILTKLGMKDFNSRIGNLSGGQKKRVALAKALIENSDLLILDEPTNHLDFESIQWLEQYIGKYQKSVLFVTHDRYFLDNISTKIWELANGNLYEYKGNYADYLESKASREENEQIMQSKKESLFKKELAWIRRGAKARTTKQKARIDRFSQLETEVSQKTSSDKLEMDLMGSRLGKKVIELIKVKKSFDSQTVLNGFSLLLKPGDRIGIVGKNGAGKSTLLNIVAGKETIDSGEIEQGTTVKIGYYTQETVSLNEGMRMIEYIREEAEAIKLKDGSLVSAANMLEKFLFPIHTHGTPISKLSGGEKRRLYLLRILMSSPNVLLMDEPTNDLDTETLTVLEDFLDSFSGVVITVSHDRYFLDKVTTELLVFLGNGEISRYYGTYTEYLESGKAEEVSAVEEKTLPQEAPQIKETKKKKKLSYMEMREWETIESDIQKVEERLEVIAKEIQQTGSDFEKAAAFMKEETELTEKLESLIERWSYLSEKMEE
ncbi:ABC-F family ATP-binding cassette domain-containing protein [Peribacillus alkalitolerans]|uniref:ABC-F family ATP-binding cassette domain-containing protein n=1 Tax=Peribacillus alkalitolerans TaxID=1550385 RepID=UPI0013D0371B|nr:ABC-F family ATP-binding cassette domain-containing protein [Peribacillus alkalitolerans]